MNSGSPAKTLARTREGRMLGGVGAGVADYFSIDVTLVRVLVAVLSVMGGAGVLAYLAARVIIPEDGAKTSIAQNVISTSPDVLSG